MSFDLYFVPGTVGLNASSAKTFVERENKLHQRPVDAACEKRKHALSRALVDSFPNLIEFQIDFSAISQYETISESEAREKYNHIELNSDAVQVYICDRMVTVSFYGSNDPDPEMLSLICNQFDFICYDPQSDCLVDTDG